MKSFSRAKAFAFTLIAQVLTLLVLLGLVEGVFRMLNPDYDLRGGNERRFFCVFDSVLGWTPKTNFTGVHEKDGFSIPVHQNQFGLRASDNLLRENPTGKRRIIVMGDSYVWGYGVGDADVFTELDMSRYGVELINFGVSGYGTDQEYLLYEKMGKDFSAEEVILVITPYNDFMNNVEPSQYGYDKPYFKLKDEQLVLHTEHLKPDLWSRLRNELSDSLRAFNYMGSLLRSFKQSFESSDKSASAPKQAVLDKESVTESDELAMALTLRIVEKLKSLVESQGRKFTVAFIPYKIHVTRNILRNHPMVPLFADKLREKEIKYLEPFYIFLQAEEKRAGLFNQNDRHFSASGHALFASTLLDPELVEQTRNYYHKKSDAS